MKLPLILAFLAIPSAAFAYPSAGVFTPSGEAKPLGQVGLLAYTATNLAPNVSAGSSWFGVEAGLLPQWKYGDSGVSFGGLEVGFDIITPYGVNTVKPVFDFKLGLVTEGIYTPSFAVGMMEMSPSLASMNFLYFSATKTLRANPDAFSYGRITLGYGLNTGNRDVFNGTFPFHNTRSALMACYESPIAFEHLGFVVDYLGGTSEISDTYVGVTLSLSMSTTVAAGAFFANDRSTEPRNDGFFAYLTKIIDFEKLFTK